MFGEKITLTMVNLRQPMLTDVNRCKLMSTDANLLAQTTLAYGDCFLGVEGDPVMPSASFEPTWDIVGRVDDI